MATLRGQQHKQLSWISSHQLMKTVKAFVCCIKVSVNAPRAYSCTLTHGNGMRGKRFCNTKCWRKVKEFSTNWQSYFPV